MAGVKGMRWGQRKQAVHKVRDPTIVERMAQLGHDYNLYSTWNMMNARCYNPKCESYPDYGGRGIEVCARWRRAPDNPEALWNFVADVGKRPEGKSIDRRDNSGGYTPENVRWATAHEQQCNKRESTRQRAWKERISPEKYQAFQGN